MTDTGIGIADQDQERIFEEFAQIDTKLQRKAKGTGLGLPLSRSLAKILGGTLVVKSELGKGSVFTLTIPASLPEHRRPQIADGGVRQVLLIDDDDTFRYVMRQIISNEPRYRLLEAKDGEEGLKMARTESPDVIILDLQMPAIDGFTVLQELAADPRTRLISVIVSTSLTINAELKARLPFGNSGDIEEHDLARKRFVVSRRDDEGGPMTAIASPIVLNVDDDDAQRYIKTRDLQASGFAVLEARSGAEALQLVERKEPEVVLLDVQLPDINGTEVCVYIKNKWPEVMVLMTSATFTSAEDRTFGLDSGADSYLLQPAERLELAAAINSLLRIRRTEDDLRSLNATLERKVADRTAELVAANARLVAEIEHRQKAEAALVQAQKMEAVGHLTGGLAHDFNNLLTAVIASFELIKMKAADSQVVARLAQNGMAAANRGAKLTAQLLAFSRVQKLDESPVDVNELVEGMTPLLKQTLGPGVEIRKRLHPDLPPAIADANQLELAILNLFINSRDAMSDDGLITLSTFADPEDCDRIVVSVEDTGSGMPPDVAERAFDPFFTTKPPGKGTGLGLSQVFGVVRQLGGDVSIRSEVGKGTDVRIWLRRSATAPRPALKDEQAFPSPNSERVLIVDDDDDVRRVLADVLSDVGYCVRDFSLGNEALEALTEFRPELMIVDYAMPGRNGAQLAQDMRQRVGDVPILFVTGYANDAALHELGERTPILRKPFRPVELAAMVRSTLDARSQKEPA